jgi:outer membrane protein W
MKKLVALVAILVLMTSMSFGQEFVSSQASGAKAILFTWSGLANINATEYAQYGIGAKMFFSDYLALRLQLQLGMGSRTEPALAPTGKEGSFTADQLGIGAAIEYHLSKSRVSPYVGAAVAFNTTSTEEKPATNGITEQTTTKNALGGIDMDGDGTAETFANTQISIVLLIGAEYYITNGLSLAAEYRIGFNSAAQKDEDYTTSTSTTTTKGGSVSFIGITSSAALTLAVYL